MTSLSGSEQVSAPDTTERSGAFDVGTDASVMLTDLCQLMLGMNGVEHRSMSFLFRSRNIGVGGTDAQGEPSIR